MPVFDLAHLLVAFQIAYVKFLCIFTSIFLGPWTGIQIYLYGGHPEGTKLSFCSNCETSTFLSIYCITLVMVIYIHYPTL